MKRWLLFFVLSCFGIYQGLSQELTLIHTTTEAYTPGSTIAVSLRISDEACIRPGNTFSLFLSDANGSFANETQIGTFSGLYTTFVNGIIPNSTIPGLGYRLRIKSSMPDFVSNNSQPFEIRAGNPVTASLTSSNTLGNSSDLFGLCNGVNNYIFYLSNESTIGSTVTMLATNELTGNSSNVLFDSQVKPLTAQLAHYTLYVRAVMPNGTVATRAYFIINNSAVTAFGTSGNNTVCLPNAVLEFNVAVSGVNGIQNNFPGNIYRIDWGDGTESLYTLCDIVERNGRVTHEYLVNSCGRTIVSGSSTVYNAFGINISASNPYCGDVGTPVSTFAKVINKPVNEFTNPGACLNQPAVFTNISIPGQDPNSTSSGCGNSAVTYTWYVNGQVVPGAVNRPREFSLNYTFTTPGKHVIRLESSSNTACPAEAVEDTVCVQEPPRPSFLLNGNATQSTVCVNDILKPQNTSFIDNTCGPSTYNWTVTGGEVSFINNSSASSAEPEFQFSQPGIYTIRLGISSTACDEVFSEEYTLTVNAPPTVVMSPDLTLCNLSAYSFNNTTSGPTRVEFNGTSEEQLSTYNWTVTGGNFSFLNETGANSKYPTIEFNEYATYTVTVTHQNNCGTTSATQTIRFEPAPIVNAGVYDSICFNGSVNLNGSVNGSVNSITWVGGTGTFSPGRNSLNAVYTPSLEERQAGSVDLILRTTTDLSSPCNVVEGFTTVNILAANLIISDVNKSICTGSAVDYTPVASQGNSTFSWTIASASANASGYSAGSGASIQDILINSSNDIPAIVTYTITPFYNGCSGEPFDFTVTIRPNPLFNFNVTENTICSGQATNIALSATLADTRYLWTSTASSPEITGHSESAEPRSISVLSDVIINKSTTVGTVTYQITPISADGCVGEPQVVEIYVKASAPNVISGDQTICEGTVPGLLTGNIPTGGDGPYTYQWQFSTDNGITWANITDADEADYAPQALSVTTIYRRVVNSFACPGSVPNLSNEITIRVNPDAHAEFNFNSNVGCAPFVLNSNNIQAISHPDRNAVYKWYANGQEIGTGIQFPGYTITQSEDTVTISLVVTSSLGCKEAEFSQDFITQSNLSASFVQDITEGCGPLDVVFTNTSSFISGASFLWDFGNGETSTSPNPGSVRFLPDPTGRDKVYTVTLTASSACSASEVFTATVLVKAAPLAVFSPDRTISCSPMQVTFSNTSLETSNTTYTFDFGDGSEPVIRTDRSSVTHTFLAIEEAQTFTITMTARNECGEHSSSHTVTVTPGTVQAELVVNSTDQRGCVPFTVPFYNNSSGASTYVYDFGDGTTLTTNSAPERVLHTYTNAGEYLVTLTASNGCSVVSTTETVTVLPQPEASFDILGQAFVSEALRFNNTSTGGDLLYQWDFGDGNSSTETNPQHSYLQQGVYQVTLTATNFSGCSDIYTSTVSVQGEPGALYLPNSFMPGSANPELRQFKAKGFGLASYRLRIFNKWGELLWETDRLIGDEPAEGWDGTYQGRILPQGVYFWRAEAVLKNGQTWKGMSYSGSPHRTSGTLNLIR